MIIKVGSWYDDSQKIRCQELGPNDEWLEDGEVIQFDSCAWAKSIRVEKQELEYHGYFEEKVPAMVWPWEKDKVGQVLEAKVKVIVSADEQASKLAETIEFGSE